MFIIARKRGMSQRAVDHDQGFNGASRRTLPARHFSFTVSAWLGVQKFAPSVTRSCVDFLVIMKRTRLKGERMSVRIRLAIPRDFPLDLLVRTPADVAKRLRWRDPFICELLEKGQVLYEANDT